MEWVKCTYPEVRDVYVDGQRCGRTNRLLSVAEGTHAFSLAGPLTFTPAQVTRTVRYTTPELPMEIAFRLKMDE
jgi:hypothetical protein